MTWLTFTLWLVIGSLWTLLWIFVFSWYDDENELDSNEEYVDNTPTFR